MKLEKTEKKCPDCPDCSKRRLPGRLLDAQYPDIGHCLECEACGHTFQWCNDCQVAILVNHNCWSCGDGQKF